MHNFADRLLPLYLYALRAMLPFPVRPYGATENPWEADLFYVPALAYFYQVRVARATLNL